MTEYIEREAVVKLREEFWKDRCDYMAVRVTNIMNIPTADVVEVRHGYWYRHDKKKHGDTCYYCSVCEKMALADCMVWELTDYCPNCGAKMDGKDDNDG